MRAAFALLANTEVHNVVRKLSWDIHQKCRTGTRHASLPPHISLKQPFAVSNLPALEEYMNEFANSIQPVDIFLDEFQAVPAFFDWHEYGLLWINVKETDALRGLHNRLNHDLNLHFGDTAADYDGDAYRFHLTVMMCGQLMEIYRNYHSEISALRIDMRFTARELAMFVYDEPLGPHSDSLCYKILPIG